MAHSMGRVKEAILTGIEDATIGTIISWLALKERLPTAESIASLVMLVAHTVTGMHLHLRSALGMSWSHGVAKA